MGAWPSPQGLGAAWPGQGTGCQPPASQSTASLSPPLVSAGALCLSFGNAEYARQAGEAGAPPALLWEGPCRFKAEMAQQPLLAGPSGFREEMLANRHILLSFAYVLF